MEAYRNSLNYFVIKKYRLNIREYSKASDFIICKISEVLFYYEMNYLI